MNGYIKKRPDENNPLGVLGKIEDMAAYQYEPESDMWIRLECRDAPFGEQEPQERWDNISDEEGDFLKYELQVAEALTHHYGNSYLGGRNFDQVKSEEALVRRAYVNGDSAEDAAIDIGYCCG